MKPLLSIVASIAFLSSCNGQHKEKFNCNNKDAAIKIISELAEVKIDQKYIDSLTQHKKGVSYMVDNEIINGQDCFRIKTGYNGKFHLETYNIFYVNKLDCKKIYINDIMAGDIITLQQWRKKKDLIKNNLKSNKELFSELFNEGTNIDFTPKDLNNDAPKIKDFKKKLEIYVDNNPLPEDFDSENLSYLLNNETFFDLQYYTNSAWLQYFITKYKIDVTVLNDLMSQAIKQEDYDAIKTLINNHYVVSEIDLEISSEAKQESENKIQENKKDGYESYIVSNSKIDEIINLLHKKFNLNKISDPDGFTNLRKEKNTSSRILQKIITGTKIEILDNSGDWWLIQTNEGQKGYVHKSRIKSE
ncbi:MAG: SH3 domain-containing protein [Flavobacterium sp.]